MAINYYISCTNENKNRCHNIANCSISKSCNEKVYYVIEFSEGWYKKITLNVRDQEMCTIGVMTASIHLLGLRFTPSMLFTVFTFSQSLAWLAMFLFKKRSHNKPIHFWKDSVRLYKGLNLE